MVGCGEGLGVCKSRAESCSLATPKRALSTRPRGLPPGPFAQPHGTHGWGGAGVSGRSRAGVCTRWPFAARRESSPLAGSEMIPSPPCFVIKSNPSGLDRDACYSRSLSSGAGISCRAWGDSPSLSHPAPAPPAFTLLCFSTSWRSRGRRRLLRQLLCSTGVPAGPLLPPSSQRVWSGRNCLHPTYLCGGQPLASGTPQKG